MSLKFNDIDFTALDTIIKYTNADPNVTAEISQLLKTIEDKFGQIYKNNYIIIDKFDPNINLHEILTTLSKYNDKFNNRFIVRISGEYDQDKFASLCDLINSQSYTIKIRFEFDKLTIAQYDSIKVIDILVNQYLRNNIHINSIILLCDASTNLVRDIQAFKSTLGTSILAIADSVALQEIYVVSQRDVNMIKETIYAIKPEKIKYGILCNKAEQLYLIDNNSDLFNDMHSLTIRDLTVDNERYLWVNKVHIICLKRSYLKNCSIIKSDTLISIDGMDTFIDLNVKNITVVSKNLITLRNLPNVKYASVNSKVGSIMTGFGQSIIKSKIVGGVKEYDNHVINRL
jgi:hypothetical protein